ncbi:hypothetical protein F4777DRAFT_534040 [Nemania sp. FL0916]|nr:hypothetical protein F4777DRAFT_534040 [Nemania sp. FL0916]
MAAAPLNDRPRYQETLHNVPKLMSELMSSYSGVPAEEQIAHITRLRNEGYAEFPYPCMGSFRFLDLDLARHEAYQEHVLAPLAQPAVPGKIEPLFLDCGCCLGQDLRKLVVDGAAPSRLWASDIKARFIELGFELFRDGHKLPRDHFLCPGNLLADADSDAAAAEDRLSVLNDRVTILSISAVFHLFDLDDHRRIADRCLRLLRKDTGAPVLIVGAHGGLKVPARLPRARQNSYRYLHNGESWEALWREVCAQPRWRDRVAAVEVKSKMFGRVHSDGPEQGDIVRLLDPDTMGDGRIWQRFEVWVTFKPAA